MDSTTNSSSTTNTSNTADNPKLGVICALSSAFLYAMTSVVVSFVKQTGLSSITVVFYRNFICIFIALAWTAMQKSNLKVSKKHVFHLTWIGFFGAFLTTLLLYTSYSYIGIGTATMLSYLYPVFAVLFAFIVFKEKIEKKQIASLAVACFGLIFFVQSGEQTTYSGVVLALASAVTYGIYIVAIEKFEITKLPMNVVSFYLAVNASICVFIFGIATNQLTLNLTSYQLFLCTIVSFGTSFGAVVLLQLGVRYLNAISVSLICLVEPVLSLVFGQLFLGQIVSMQQVIGSLIILIGLCCNIKAKNI